MLLDIPKYLQDSKSVYVCVIDSAGKYTYVNDLFKRKYSFIASNLLVTMLLPQFMKATTLC